MENGDETGQEAFWAGGFGNENMTRNRWNKPIAGNLALLNKTVSCARLPASGVGIGPNIGRKSWIADTTLTHP